MAPPTPRKLPSDMPGDLNGISIEIMKWLSRAQDAWSLYTTRLSLAYQDAYDGTEERQGVKSILSQIRNREDEQQKHDEEAFSFFLSLLTVGISGACGGMLARTLFVKTQEIRFDTSKALGQFLAQRGLASAKAAIDPFTAVGGDVFVPIGPPPFKYFLELRNGIETVKLAIDNVQNFMDREFKGSGPYLSVDTALDIADWVWNHPYVKNSPTGIDDENSEGHIDQGILTQKTRLALWIAWAYKRDIPYWSGSGKWDKGVITTDDSLPEFAKWEAVRQDLHSLQVPVDNITIDTSGLLYNNYDIDPTPYRYIGLDVWGFCRWLSSPAAPALLFDGLPRKFDGLALSVDRMKYMKAFPWGWIDTFPRP